MDTLSETGILHYFVLLCETISSPNHVGVSPSRAVLPHFLRLPNESTFQNDWNCTPCHCQTQHSTALLIEQLAAGLFQYDMFVLKVWNFIYTSLKMTKNLHLSCWHARWKLKYRTIIHNLIISYNCFSLVAFALPVVFDQFMSVMILIHWIQKRLPALEPQVRRFSFSSPWKESR